METRQIKSVALAVHENGFNGLLSSKERVSLLCISAITGVLAFYLFKRLYPYPNFLPDSYFYINAAFSNESINIWPIGYSKFLRLFSSFTHSHYLLIFFQYCFLQGSIFYFTLTLSNLFNTGKWATRLLVILNTVNPILLYLSNMVCSDALFTGLSLIWITQLFGLSGRPTLKQYACHATCLLLAFSMRYSALYYPLISLAVILLSRDSLRNKFAGAALVVLLIGGFVAGTMRAYKKQTGITLFSPFGGWQMATNALYALSRSGATETALMPARLQPLRAVVTRHLDSLKRLKVRPDSIPGIYYLWDENAPLKKYMNRQYAGDTTTPYLKRWSSQATLFSDYGSRYMANHPKNYMRYFLLPNLRAYYLPPAEFLGVYNMGSDSVSMSAKLWFDLKTQRVQTYFKSKRIQMAKIYTVLSAIINTLFLLSVMGTVLLYGLRLIPKPLWMMVIVWSVHIVFSVLASPVVLRYEIFTMILALSGLLILLPRMIERQREGSESTMDYPLGI